MDKGRQERAFSKNAVEKKDRQRVWDHNNGSRIARKDVPLSPTYDSGYPVYADSSEKMANATNLPLDVLHSLKKGQKDGYNGNLSSKATMLPVQTMVSKRSSSPVQDPKVDRFVSATNLLPTMSMPLNIKAHQDKKKRVDVKQNGFNSDSPASKGVTEASSEYDLEDPSFEKTVGRCSSSTKNPLAAGSRRTIWVLLSISCLLLAAFATILTTYLIKSDEADQVPPLTGRTKPVATDNSPVNPSIPAAPPTTAPADSGETLAESPPFPVSRTPTEAPTRVGRTKTFTGIPTVSREVQEDPNYDVIVIGAGWAGLAAMDVLTRNGISSARILEARDYIGGRSHTIRDIVPGLPIELGSAWVYEETSLIDRQEELGIKYTVTNSGFDAMGLYETPTMRGGSGISKLSSSEKQALWGKIWSGDNGFVPFVRNEVPDMREDVDFEQVVDEYLDEEGSDLTQEDQQFLHAMTHSEIGSEFAAPLNELSAQESAYVLDGPESMHYLAVPGGGYDSMINDLAESFMDRIQLNSRVTLVQYGEDGQGELARVTYVDETGATRTATASAVLVTVPLGVLKASDIEFVPALPQQKLDAINGLGYGNLNKCIMYWEETDQDWWPTDQVWLGLVTDEDETSGVWTLFLNDVAQGNGGNHVLVGFISGDDADAMESQTDEKVLDAVLFNLRTMLGGSVPKPTKYLVTRWGQDEFSRGAYSFPYAGSDWSLRSALQSRVGNLFFAGEATDDEWYATTEGAYNSGIKAGEEIVETLEDS